MHCYGANSIGWRRLVRSDGVFVLHDIAQVVHAFEQAQLAEGIDIKFVLLAIGQRDRLVGQIDS